MVGIVDTMEGPAWSPHALDVAAGRFPLSVEPHLMQMTAKMVPGATTVTINARYYALHGLVAAEAEARSLDLRQAYDLLRRCEVVLAAASILHPSDAVGSPHANDWIKPRLEREQRVDVLNWSKPKTGYAQPESGFLAPYIGSELQLRILGGNQFAPGTRYADGAIRSSFEGIFDLAACDELELDALRRTPHLALAAGPTSSDGAWLAKLLCGVGIDDPIKIDHARRDTIRLLARALMLQPSSSFVESFRDVVAYGDFVTADPVGREIEQASAWQGTLFRHESVGAWRLLWSWMVEQVTGLMPPEDLVAAVVDALPGGALGDFISALPATVDEDGHPVRAEGAVRAQARTIPDACVAILALGAQRVTELEGRALEAFCGKRVALAPEWMRSRVQSSLDMPLADFANRLVHDLLERSQRIALRKMRQRADGSIWLPTRLHERGGLLYRTSNEGRGNVGLRIDQLGRILMAIGVFESIGGNLTLTDAGEALLGVGRA